MRWKHLFLRPMPGELSDELNFHFERLVEQKIKAGQSEDEARRQARVEFGNLDRAIDATAAQYPGWWLERVKQDVRYGLRGLRRNLVFTGAAVLTLALGIGATTAVFSVIDRILFRSLPYAHDDRLVSVGLVAPIMPQYANHKNCTIRQDNRSMLRTGRRSSKPPVHGKRFSRRRPLSSPTKQPKRRTRSLFAA